MSYISIFNSENSSQCLVFISLIFFISQLGNNSTTSFNPKSEGGNHELKSPRLQPDNIRTLPQGGQATHSQWPASEPDGRPISGGET